MTTGQLLSSGWRWEPWGLVVCLGVAAAYGWSVRFRFSARSLFALAGLGVVVLALLSPIDLLASRYLFSAHMLQHLLLQLVAPPLLLLGIPQGPAPKAFQRGPLRLLREGIEQPVLTWFLGLGAMWIWHVPALCSASVADPWVTRLQTLSLLGMGGAFWWPIMGPWARRYLSPPMGVVYLFSACIGCTILGIILTFAPLGVCPVFLHPADPVGILRLVQDEWGLTPARDQQLGGLLMWVPPCFVYMTGIFSLFARWYTGPDPELALPEGTLPSTKAAS